MPQLAAHMDVAPPASGSSEEIPTMGGTSQHKVESPSGVHDALAVGLVGPLETTLQSRQGRRVIGEGGRERPCVPVLLGRCGLPGLPERAAAAELRRAAELGGGPLPEVWGGHGHLQLARRLLPRGLAVGLRRLGVLGPPPLLRARGRRRDGELPALLPHQLFAFSPHKCLIKPLEIHPHLLLGVDGKAPTGVAHVGQTLGEALLEGAQGLPLLRPHPHAGVDAEGQDHGGLALQRYDLLDLPLVRPLDDPGVRQREDVLGRVHGLGQAVEDAARDDLGRLAGLLAPQYLLPLLLRAFDH
mmetsp:Transcript_8035/g.21792  ORF Transcript_8035/g.21792 Transcript_8035/m.21792 type:complete len:300 (-) Transcript_8035:92-991(-)